MAVKRLTVPQMPSQGDLRLVAKNVQFSSKQKSVLRDRFKMFLKFLNWQAHPLKSTLFSLYGDIRTLSNQ